MREKIHVKFFLRKITCKTVLLVFIDNKRYHTSCPCLQMLGMRDWNLDSTGMTIPWLFDQQACKLLGVY